jgi:hypothetical protein
VTGFYHSSHSLPLFVLAEVFTRVLVREGNVPGHSADHFDCQGHHHKIVCNEQEGKNSKQIFLATTLAIMFARVIISLVTVLATLIAGDMITMLYAMDKKVTTQNRYF